MHRPETETNYFLHSSLTIEFVQSSEFKTILVVYGNDKYNRRKNELTTAWNGALYQTHSCRTTAITSREQPISIRAYNNYDVHLGKICDNMSRKNIKKLGEIPNHAV